MKVVVEHTGPCRKTLKISATGGELKDDFENVIASFMRDSQLPGFRAGKAPRARVEKHYEKGILDAVKDEALSRLYHEAVREQKVTPVSIIDVRDTKVSRTEGIQFTVLVDVPPEFKLPAYKKLSVDARPVAVADDEMQQAFDRMINAFSRFEDVTDRAAAEGDLVQVDYSGTCGGQPMKAAVPSDAGLGEGKDLWVVLGEHEFLPGLARALVGVTTGETRTHSCEFPADFRVREAAGKKAEYTLQVKAVRRRVRPEMNEEFFKRMGLESEEGLRNMLRSDLLARKEQAEKNRQKEELVKKLLAETSMEVPQSVVDEETQHEIRGILQHIVRQGATRQQVQEQQKDIIEAATRNSNERVRMTYILSRIADEEKIEVTDEEVALRIQAMAQNYNMPVEKMRAELDQKNGMENLRHDVQIEKTLDFLQGLAVKNG